VHREVVSARRLEFLELIVTARRNERLCVHLETQCRSECPLDAGVHRDRRLMNVRKYIPPAERAFGEWIADASHELTGRRSAAPIGMEAHSTGSRGAQVEVRVSPGPDSP